MASSRTSSTPPRGDGQTGPVPATTAPRRQRPLGPEPTVLVIGYPAPAARQIVERLLATDARTIACVVPRGLWPQASQMHRSAQDCGRVRLFEGAAATPGLGLPCTAWRILDTTDEIYGVASSEEIAAGHIQDFADECPRLRELHLVAQDPAEHEGHDSRSKWDALRRLRGSLSAPVRTSFGTLTTAFALGVAGVALVAPFMRAVRPWKDLLDFDIETALSWEDLERDLSTGLQRAT